MQDGSERKFPEGYRPPPMDLEGDGRSLESGRLDLMASSVARLESMTEKLASLVLGLPTGARLARLEATVTALEAEVRRMKAERATRYEGSEVES